MAVRHNLCLNPALKNNITGWDVVAGAAVPTRTDVTGLGFVRNTAARYTSGSFAGTAATAMGAVTVGLDYTLSFYTRPQTSPGNATFYIEWINAGGGGFGYPSAPMSAPTGQVSRWSISATAPTNAVAARLIIEGNFGANTTDITALLFEQAAAIDTYFDGDTVPGGSWDGADGNSASTLSPGQTVNLGQAVETDTALTLASRLKSRTLGQPATTETALPLARRLKTRVLGIAVETDTAPGLQLGVPLPDLTGSLAPAGRSSGTLTPSGRLSGTLT